MMVSWFLLAIILLVTLPVAVFLAIAGANMLRMRSYGLAVAGCVLAMLPCHPLFLLGLPIGLWGLLVLLKPEVKAAFGEGSSAWKDVAPRKHDAGSRRHRHGWLIPLAALGALLALPLLAVAGYWMMSRGYGVPSTPAHQRYDVRWHEPEEVGPADVEQLCRVVNQRLAGDEGGPVAVVHRPGSILVPHAEPTRQQTLVVNLLSGKNTPNNREMVRERLAIEGTFELRLLAHPELDADLVEQADRWWRRRESRLGTFQDLEDPSQMVEATAEGSSEIVSADGKRGRWMPVHFSSVIPLQENERAVTRALPGSELGDRVEVLVLVDEFHLTERHIVSASLESEASYGSVLCLRFEQPAQVAWRRMQQKYPPRTVSFFSGREQEGRQPVVLLDGQLYEANVVTTLGTPQHDVRLALPLSATERKHWRSALDSGPLPAKLRLVAG